MISCSGISSNQIKSNLFEDTIISVKEDFKAGKPALTEALNTIKDETKQHKIQKLNELHRVPPKRKPPNFWQ